MFNCLKRFIIILSLASTPAMLSAVSPAPCLAALSSVDISGPWNSNFGPVDLKVLGKDADGLIIVSGSWRNAGNVGEIIYGRFAPATTGGVLKIEYYVPSRQIYGYGEFKLATDNSTLTGQYYEADQSGNWNLNRGRGYKTAMLGDLPTLSKGISTRSDKINNPSGTWNSSFGVVELTGVSLGPVMTLKGKFTKSDGKVGEIPTASFTRVPGGAILKFDYTAPWNNRKGTATFHTDKYVANRQLIGSYNESGSTGTWILTRPLDKAK